MGDWMWTRRSLWLFITIGLQVGLFAAAVSDSVCDSKTEFRCRGDACIALARVRDGSPDCPDGSDEECNSKEEFQCRTIHQCIPKERFQDGWPDCDDGSDEECSGGQHRCRCGLPHCVDGHRVKDGVKDCIDGSDEEELVNKTTKCPDENRLQDLLAMEKRRRKRQIDHFSGEDTSSKSEEKVHSSQEARIISNKYKKNRYVIQSKVLLLPTKELYSKTIDNLNIKIPEVSKIPSRSAYKVSTETESYGSLVSGKIYQTAVNEPVSVIPTSAFTLIKFDHELPKKTSHTKKATEQLSKRVMHSRQHLSDIMQKIIFLFQNDSQKQNERKNFTKQNEKFAKRKLLSVASEEPQLENHKNKRAASSEDISHIPLEYETVVSQQSLENAYTTGTILSTTGIDVMNGLTTAWTTVIEGSFVKGTYAHIIHSTSRIFFTVETTNSTPADSISPSSIFELNSLIKPSSVKELSDNKQVSSSISSPTSDSNTVSGKNTTFDDVNPSPVIKPAMNIIFSETDSHLLNKISINKNLESSSKDEIELKPSISITEALEMQTSLPKIESEKSSTKKEGISEDNKMMYAEKHNIEMMHPDKDSIIKMMQPEEIRHSGYGMMHSEKVVVSNNEMMPSEEDALLLNILGRMMGTENVSAVTDYGTNEDNFQSNIKLVTEKSDLNETVLKGHKSVVLGALAYSLPALTSTETLKIENSKSTEVKDISTDINNGKLFNNITDEEQANSSLHSKSISLITSMKHDTDELSLKNENHSIENIAETDSLITSNAMKVLLTNSSTEEFGIISNSQTDIQISTAISNASGKENQSIAPIIKAISSFVTFKVTDNLTDITKTESSILSTSKNLSLESSFRDALETPSVIKELLGTPVFLMSSMNTDNPSILVDSSHFSVSTPSLESESFDTKAQDISDTTSTVLKDSTNVPRSKRAVPTLVTVLNPEGRIISTDARVYLTPTTHYTTYTYFTTILKPGGGTQIQSSLEVDTVIVYPSDRSDYDQPCCDDHVHHDRRDGVYVTHFPSTYDHHHIETVPYDNRRPNEITHKTTYTYYTTKFRGGSSFVETRKETETNVTPVPSTGRYSPFEIGTYYEPDIDELHHYHTEAPLITGSRPRDITHRTTYTYFTTRFQNSVPIVETRKETDTHVTAIPTIHRHGILYIQGERAPVYSQPIDRNLYKPDRVTHRTTYTYHTTRFRNGVPIVNTRKETETNVTPIPTYARSTVLHRTRVIPNRVVTHPVERTAVSYDDHPYNQYDPYITHRTTYTYYTTNLRGGDVHVDTRYVTETNLTPNPSLRHTHVTALYDQPHDQDNGFYADQCDSCRNRQQHPSRDRTRVYVPPRNLARDRTVILPNERDVVRPSTATHLTTYTYATTTLARGDIPVVRTREHTVTEVYSDVVLPTLKYGDRIRSKRDTVLDDRENVRLAYRQGRRISPDEFKARERKIENVSKSKEMGMNGNDNNNLQITPTRITYYSTFTYFTTELGFSVPIVKTREHTVTEILSDVIVPTVSFVRNLAQNTKIRTISPRAKRTALSKFDLFVKFPNQRKLLSIDELKEGTSYSAEEMLSTDSTTQLENATISVSKIEINEENTPCNSDGQILFNTSSCKLENTLTSISETEMNDTFSKEPSLFSTSSTFQIENTSTSVSDTKHLNIENLVALNNNSSPALFPKNVESTSEVHLEETLHLLWDDSLDATQTKPNSGYHTIKLTEENIKPTVTVKIPDILMNKNETTDDFKIHSSDALVFSVSSISLTGDLLNNTMDKNLLNSIALETDATMERSKSTTSLRMKSESGPAVNEGNKSTESEKVKAISTTKAQSSVILKTVIPEYVFDILSAKASFISTPSINEDSAPTRTSDFLPKLDDIDLTAEGAERIYSSRVSPSTYFTTYTYYSTILKPGGQREVKTNTKVVSSTLYDSFPTSQGYARERAPHRVPNENILKAKNERKCCNKEPSFIHPTRIRDLQTDEAVVRTVLPDYRSNQPYKPSFADKIRGPFYDTSRSTKYVCSSCVNRHLGRNNHFVNKKIEGNAKHVRLTPYLTSIPILKPSTYIKRIPDTRAVFYPEASIKPTAVTFYSTYTYFTTELKNGSPYIRSREHTVTEILTDVIVPTVSHVPHQNSVAHYKHRRNKRYIKKKLFERKAERLSDLFKRKLLSVKEADFVAKNVNDYNKDFHFLNRHKRSVPVTHFTTNTYYKTLLKPGNKKEIETSTKLISSVYYNKIEPTRTVDSYSTPFMRHETIRRQDEYQLNRNKQYASRFQKPYYLLPSRTPRRFDTGTHQGQLQNQNKAKSNILKEYEKRYKVTETNIPIQPSLVTFYSTYTYFTTELAGGNPVIRSREHTVTEILSDVIVPTVVKLRPKRSDIINSTYMQQLMSDKSVESLFPHRKLLSVNDLLDFDAYEKNETNKANASGNNISNLKIDKYDSNSENFSTSSREPNDSILSSLQYSKAYAAYLDYLRSSNLKISKDHTNFEILNFVPQSESTFKSSITDKYSIPKVTASVSLSSSEYQNEDIISVATSTIKRNGRMTKYTTTIYGTYVNGVYAQRAKSNSDIVPLTTEIDVSVTTSLQFTPSRLSGLVQSVVSRKIRGPVAVHLTTEIHGIFIGGAYAQTARVFTSSQPLSSTRQPFSLRLPSITATSTAGVRKTGLLSTRIMRSKIDGSTTLLFVSEIYGTHIGGAYAHLGTYTTRTIIPSSTSIDIEPTTSPSLSTFHIDDLTTGLVTASVSDRVMNDSTIRYHFEVYGTYLSGTYAHVPSISTETIHPFTTHQYASFTHSRINNEPEGNILSPSGLTSNPDKSMKIGLIEASTREGILNGTTTHHILEVYGTYLNGTYAHVPRVSVENFVDSNFPKNDKLSTSEASVIENSPNSEFEILTIFSTDVIDSSTFTDSNANIYFSEPSSFLSNSFTNNIDMFDSGIVNANEREKDETFNLEFTDLEKNEHFLESDKNLFSSSFHQQMTPILLPEALRTSFSPDVNSHRYKRSLMSLSAIESSFLETNAARTDLHDLFEAIKTTPLPHIITTESSLNTSPKFKCKIPKTKCQTKMDIYETSILKKSKNRKRVGPEFQHNIKSEVLLNRKKRTPPASRNIVKRFGSSSTLSSSRRFRSFNTDRSTPTSRGFRSSSRASSSTYSKPSKSVPSFLSRSLRSKSTTSTSRQSNSVNPTSSSSYKFLPGRTQKFGKKESDEVFKDDEDIEASEAVAESVSEETFQSKSFPKLRLHRPSKAQKNNHSSLKVDRSRSKSRIMSIRASSTSHRFRSSTKNKYIPSNKRKTNSRSNNREITPTATETADSTSTKRRFTLTTTFSPSLNPTASFLSTIEDSGNSNNLQEDTLINKRKNRKSNSNSNFGSFRKSTFLGGFENDENEVTPDIPKALPLPVFGRTRGTKRPPKFDPRTIKSSVTSTTMQSETTSFLDIDSTSVISDENYPSATEELTGPITVTNVFTTTKTLPVHLGLRTSFATITTTGYSTSTIQTEDLTKYTIGGITKTLLSAVTNFPDANSPPDKQFTVVTEILLTTTTIETTSLVAIKFGYGTRTDTVVNRQILTTLATQTNTLLENTSTQIPHQYPYFPNPYAPQVPTQNNGYSLSLSENSFVSTQTLTSTTVLPLFLNGKSILTTLTSTTLSETTLVKTATIKVPHLPTAHPFVFPQPVFILPSVTTDVTVKFTAPNGEVFSIVTTITVPLAINSHTRYARSVQDIETTQVLGSPATDSVSSSLNPSLVEKEADSYENILFSNSLLADFSSNLGQLPSQSSSFDEEPYPKNKFIRNESFKSRNSPQLKKKEFLKDELHIQNPLELASSDSVTFKSRKLLQIVNDNEESDVANDKDVYDVVANLDKVSGIESNSQHLPSTDTYMVDTFHIIGPGFNDDGPGRPIPNVRVIPTRRAYIRRIKPETSRNQPLDRLSDEYYARSNLQNFPGNVPDADFYPGRRYPNENFNFDRNVRGYPNNLVVPPQDFPVNNFAPIRGAQYFSPNRPNSPFESPYSAGVNLRPPQNFEAPRTNRPTDTFGRVRNSPVVLGDENRFRAQADGFDTLRNLPSYSPTRQSVPDRNRNEDNFSSKPITEASDNLEEEPGTTSSPRRVIRLRRPGGVQLNRSPPPSPSETLSRKPIINSLPEAEDVDSTNSRTRARGPAITTNKDERRPNRIRGNNAISPQPSNALPLTYYTTFTYMTTFLNGPSTAYSTREAVVSNVATETLNPRVVGLIRTRGGFTSQTGIPTAVPLGSRAQGATTTIVNLASRVQLYNSDVYYGRSTLPDDDGISLSSISSSTVQITDIATLPKTYYTLFTYYYTLKDDNKSTHSQRSETLSNIDSQTDQFVTQDFSSTIDGQGLLTLKPDNKLINLGLRTAQGTTTEVNLELKTLIKFDNIRNAVIDRGSMTPTLVEVMPSETDAVFNNYLEPGDAEVQDQQTYPQTVAIQPSFSSAVDSQSDKASSSDETTPEIPGNNRLFRTQSLRGPLRITTTVLQRPGSGTFVPRPGVRIRVKPVTSSPSSVESSETDYYSPNDYSPTNPDFTTEEVVDGDDSEEDFSTETDLESTTESGSQETGQQPGRKRLKITIRRSPGISSSRTSNRAIRPTRTRPRFYVVTRTASPERGSNRASKRPVSVKISRKPRPTANPQYETYTTMTSVPVVFGLSTTYRNALVTSSSLVQPEDVQPSKTVIFTYFTTTTYTVPYTVDGKATFTTLEETNSRFVTETLDSDADLSLIATPTLNEDALRTSSFSNVRQSGQTLKPQLVNNQLNVGPRVNLITKVSNGVSLIVASDGEVTQPTLTLSPTIVTDALLMMDKDKTTFYEPRTLLTTFTFFTTFFNEGTPSISTSEQVVTNVYSVPVTQPVLKPTVVTETSENLVSTTYYTTHTFYATLFNGTETVVTPLEELQSLVVSSTETYTITKTITPTLPATLPVEMKTTQLPQLSTTTTSLYKTVTNYVTLFRGSESIVSPLEEIATDIITLTLDNKQNSPSSAEALYVTRTIQATNTHYITLFNNGESILSSITEVVPSVITELFKQPQQPAVTTIISPSRTLFVDESTSTRQNMEPTFQDLVPSIRTQYTTLTYFTTLFTDSSTILSSREEIATSYITLFVPAPPVGSSTIATDEYTRQMSSQRDNLKSSSESKISPKPSSEILTFYTTYTYYTTLFRGTETIISDSETVVTQYVTIESTPTESAYRPGTTPPPNLSRSSDSVEIRVEPTSKSSISTQSGSTQLSSPSNIEFDEDIQIIGVETKVQSESPPSIITGIPSTDANGATHILFTDFIVPSGEDTSSSSIASSTKSTAVSYLETTFFNYESQTPSSARDSASDHATTRLTDANIATHHIALHPTTTYQAESPQTLGIKPGAVIDLSDVLTNTNLVGNLGETIKDIVNLFAANGNKQRINSTKQIENNDSPLAPPVGGATVSNVEEPIYIPIGAIGRNTKLSSSTTIGGILRPSTLITGFTPMVNYDDAENIVADDSRNTLTETIESNASVRPLSSVIIGTDTIFINPSGTDSVMPETLYISESDGRYISASRDHSLQGSISKHENNDQNKMSTPGIDNGESTSLITGLETIFFGFPDARKPPPPQTTNLLQGSASTSSVVGVETIFFDSPGDLYARGPSHLNISGATTIFGTFPPIAEATDNKDSATPSSSSGDTTIFFPVPGDSPEHSHPGTRYVTSVESVTLTLTLTTSNVHQTEGTFVTDTSVFTTTIPPRTYVSTIIGSRTILGTQPEPTEALQVIPTMQPSESTTTVTTTTLIFNSIATTVVRTLVIPTHGVQPTRPATGTSTDSPRLAGILTVNQRPKVTTEKSTTTRKTFQLFKSGNRPTEPTTTKPARTGPPLKLFPTKPPTTTTQKPPRTTTKESSFRKPGKTLVPITDGCPRECNLKNKEVCKQNVDKSWSCQCRPGFFKKDGSDECKDVKSYVVLVRVLQMGGNEVSYQPELDNSLSPEYHNLTTTARKAVDDAYKTSNVRDHFVSTNVIGVHQGRNVLKEGVLVNLTIQLSGDKPANEEFLKEELAQSLEFAASEIDLANATIVSPIIQRVEDVQDFDECSDDTYNDCSRSSVCVNLPGSYSCECKEGYQDLEPLLPGRICSGEIKDCDYCNNRGICIMTEDDNKFCRCYRMYLGKQCEINGLVLAIALPIALALLILTMFCLLCGCRKLRQKRAQKPKQNNVFKGMVPPMAGTLDRKAMIMDSSSESSGEHRATPHHAYNAGFEEDIANSTMKRRSEMMEDRMSEFQVPTVLIPRARHSHPKQMILGRDDSTFTTLPCRRMSTQSLICETSSMYPSVSRRQGSLTHLDHLSSYDPSVNMLNDVKEARLPPPARSTGQGRRRRMSVTSSQAANVGSGHEYVSERGSLCHSSLGHLRFDSDPWQSRDRSSHSDFLNEVSMPPSSTITRQRVWSEAGRSCDDTLRASSKNLRDGSEYLVPGSTPLLSRRLICDNDQDNRRKSGRRDCYANSSLQYSSDL